MKHEKTSFISGRIKSVTYALKGLYVLVSTEHSVMVQLIISTLVCILGFYMRISTVEWMFQILAIGLVLTAESLNTAIEALCDYLQPKYDQKIGFIKDIAAGAVTFAALTAFVIGAIIYLPKLF